MSEPTDRELNHAANLLCNYVEKRLPQGFKLLLVMDSDESFLHVKMPRGQDLCVYPEGDCSFREHVEAAIEAAEELAANE